MKIAVFNTAFLGDAVLSLPILQNLAKLKNVEVHFYVRKNFSQIFRDLTDNFTVFELDKKHHSLIETYKFAKNISAQNYDVLISCHQSFRTSLISYFSSVPMRIGYDTYFHQKLAYTHLVKRDFDKLAEVERLLNLLKPLQGLSGFDKLELSNTPKIELKPKIMDKADEFFTKLENSPILGIHPGSTWATKRWHEPYYAQIIKKALANNYNILIFGASNEVPILNDIFCHLSIEEQNSALIHNLMGQLSLSELCAYISKLDCYLTNDSGPMHLAWVQNVPLVALFGPTVERFGFFPRGEKSIVLESENELLCRPCNLHGPQVCPEKTHACMVDITPERVWNEIVKHCEA